MPLQRKAAKRYAKALFEAVRESGELEAAREDVEALQVLLRQSPDLSLFLADYVIPRRVRSATIDSLFATRLHPVVHRFLAFLETKKRLALLDDVCAAFMERYDRSVGIVNGRVTSPFDVDADAVRRIIEGIGKRVPGRLVCAFAVDPELLGGFRVRVGDVVYDLSLAMRLRALRQRTASA